MKTSATKSSLWGTLKSKRFVGFFGAQFLGALNDNLAKNTLVALLAFESARFGNLDANSVSNAAAALFILPFFLGSAFCGMIADKVEKRTIAIWVKLLEFAIQMVVLVGFYYANVWVLLGCIFLLGWHSTLFGPVKGSIIPALVPEHQIVAANGLISGSTFFAILMGAIGGGLLGAMGPQGGIYVGIMGIALALFGLFCAIAMPKTGAVAPELKISWHFWAQTKQTLMEAREPISVWRSIFGISWFWFFGLTILTQFPVYAKDVLGTDAVGLSVLLAVFSIGVAAGSAACNKLSSGSVEVGLVPVGSLGMSICALLFYFLTPSSPFGENIPGVSLFAIAEAWALMGSLFFLAFFGGLFIVPLQALIQTRAIPHKRARVIGANNILNSGFMVGSAIFGVLMLNVIGASIAQVVLTLGFLNLLVAIYIYHKVPEFVLRFYAWVLTHTMYRMRIEGIEKIKKEGAALLVCNHVSFADAFILMGSIGRPVRFVMDWKIYNAPLLKWLFEDAQATPIASAKENLQVLEDSFEKIKRDLEQGHLVLIFPEGQITYDGNIGTFKGGMERILKQTPVPVYVLTLSGLWGSFFSRKYGKAMSRPFPRGAFNKVYLDVSDEQPSTISAKEAQAICERQRKAP